METSPPLGLPRRQKTVVIRGIPKEGWKHVLRLKPRPARSHVVIRGIPKEGWKRSRASGTRERGSVVIRGIPKEGWKLF